MDGNTEMVRYIMNPDLISVSFDSNLDTAFLLMRKNGIRHLLVRDEEGKFCGILTDRDLQRAMSPHLIRSYGGVWESYEFDPQYIVSDFMSWPVEVISEDASVEEAARAMLENKISSLLIVKDDEAKGIITTIDLLAYLIGEMEAANRPTWKESLNSFLMRSQPMLGTASHLISQTGI